MKLLEQILLAVDVGQDTEPLLGCAAQLARTFNARVLLVHVVATGGGGGDAAAETAREQLAAVAARLEGEGVRVDEPVLETGAPGPVLCAQAHQRAVNLIMLGTGSGRRWGAVRIGRVAEHVVCRASQSVWLVKAGAWPPAPRILCPVDFYDTSRRVLQTALQLARSCRSPLDAMAVARPVRGFPALFGGGVDHDASARLLDRTRASLQELLQGYDLHGVTVERTVTSGRSHEEILTRAQDSGADLLVLGALGRGSLSALCPSLTQRLVRALPCSILAVKRDAPFRVQLEADPERAEELFAEGEELLKQGLPEEALRQFERCIEQDPMYVDAWGGAALAHERLGQTDRADHAWQQAWQLRERLWELQAEAQIRGHNMG